MPFPPGSQTPQSGLFMRSHRPELGAVGPAWTELVAMLTYVTIALGKLLRSGPQFTLCENVVK